MLWYDIKYEETAHSQEKNLESIKYLPVLLGNYVWSTRVVISKLNREGMCKVIWYVIVMMMFFLVFSGLSNGWKPDKGEVISRKAVAEGVKKSEEFPFFAWFSIWQKTIDKEDCMFWFGREKACTIPNSTTCLFVALLK